jgi:hypothetical protein
MTFALIAWALLGQTPDAPQDPAQAPKPAGAATDDKPKVEPVPTPAPTAAPPALFPAGQLDHEGLTATLRKLAEGPTPRAALTSLAKSGEGRDVWLVQVGAKPAPATPALVIVANLEGDALISGQVAVALIDRLAAATADSPLGKAMADLTVYVVPRLNPDGAEATLKGATTRTNLRPIDRDRDGAKGEDGPDDLDGDGLITSLFVPDTQATLKVDPKDPRLMLQADAAKGEPARFSEYAEGKDDDGDGLLNEDPAGGVNLARNWPYRWPEFDREAGEVPVGEPETLALVRFAFVHPEIYAVWSLGLMDNLREAPKKPGSSLDDGDLPVAVELSRLYGEAIKTVPKDVLQPAGAAPVAMPELPAGTVEAPPRAREPLPLEGTSDGSIADWAYHHLGAFGLASRPWNGPDLPDPGKDQPAWPKEREAVWLAWNDRVVNGQAFAPLARRDHPTLGPVLVGGWKPGVRVNPPVDKLKPLADAHASFLEQLLNRRPKLGLAGVSARPLGGGLFEIKARVENRGTMPTATARAARDRLAPPVLVTIDAGAAKIIAGRKVVRVDRIKGPSGSSEVLWIIAATKDQAEVVIEASCPKAGRASQTVKLTREDAR